MSDDGATFRSGPGRRVSIRRDGDDFVIAYEPEEFIIFRGKDVSALRRLCRQLRWEVVADLVAGG